MDKENSNNERGKSGKGRVRGKYKEEKWVHLGRSSGWKGRGRGSGW